jgi:hypothetical protein
LIEQFRHAKDDFGNYRGNPNLPRFSLMLADPFRNGSRQMLVVTHWAIQAAHHQPRILTSREGLRRTNNSLLTGPLRLPPSQPRLVTPVVPSNVGGSIACLHGNSFSPHPGGFEEGDQFSQCCRLGIGIGIGKITISVPQISARLMAASSPPPGIGMKDLGIFLIRFMEPSSTNQ